MRAVLGTTLLVWSAYATWAQTAPAFEVASVKVRDTKAGERRRDPISTTPASVTMMGVPLKAIIQWAYHLQAIQVSGPSWLDQDQYEIVAKASSPTNDEVLREMMRGVLAERFKLEFHKESKVLPAYIVTVAKTGHKMKQSEGEGPMEVQPGPSRMVANFKHVTMSQLSEMAGSPLQGIVIDQTGLKGAWDFSLDASSFVTIQPTSVDDMIGAIIAIVGEQLGIKIEQKKAPADIYVIDHVERIPVGN